MRSDNVSTAVNDYRVLQPRLMTDPNGNRSEVAFDTLGMVVGTAVMGKDGEDEGRFAGRASWPTWTRPAIARPSPGSPCRSAQPSCSGHHAPGLRPVRLPAHPGRCATAAGGCLHAGARNPRRRPAAGEQTRIQHSFSYSDGFGREIQKKIQAEPGPLREGGPVVNPRWVGSGWTIFNNKGKPVRQYEPFFSATHGFEFGSRQASAPSCSTTRSGAWSLRCTPTTPGKRWSSIPGGRTTWDVNDTVAATAIRRRRCGHPRLPGGVLQDPARHLADLVCSSASSGATRPAGANAPRRRPRTTPTRPRIAHFDTLGRPFLTLAHNGFDRRTERRCQSSHPG